MTKGNVVVVRRLAMKLKDIPLDFLGIDHELYVKGLSIVNLDVNPIFFITFLEFDVSTGIITS